MIQHPISEEILERLWILKEDGIEPTSIGQIGLSTPEAEIEEGLETLTREVMISGRDPIRMTPRGEERARGIIRRHRLAEIMFSEVLELDPADAEASACEFEHMLSERVVDRVCSFLGHPPKCPHGLSIPQGSCCNRFERTVEPLVARLCDLPISGTGKIVFMAPAAAWLNKLSGLGIVPGTEVRLVQRKPSYVVASGQTSIAIEDEIARGIYVRTEGAPN